MPNVPDTVLRWSEIATKMAIWVILAFVGVLVWVAQAEIEMNRKQELRLIDIERDIAVIKSNRYTSTDAVADHRLQAKEIAEFKMWIQENYPPKWLLTRLESIDKRLERLEERSMP